MMRVRKIPKANIQILLIKEELQKNLGFKFWGLTVTVTYQVIIKYVHLKMVQFWRQKQRIKSYGLQMISESTKQDNF